MRVDKKSKRRRYIWDNSFDSTTFSWRNCKSIEIKKMRRKNNYVMRRLDTPKKVTLPNCRTFYTENCKSTKISTSREYCNEKKI